MTTFQNPSRHTAYNLEKVTKYLSEEFIWASTREGEPYWQEVYDRLLVLAKEAKDRNFPAEGKILQEIMNYGGDGLVFISGDIKVPTIKIVHIFDKGRTLCGILSRPSEWPKDHERVSLVDALRSTCVACKKVHTGK